MPTTPTGISYFIESYNRSTSDTRQESTMTCLVRWNLAAAFETEFQGWHQTTGVTVAPGQPAVKRTIPQRDPYRTWLLCVSCETTGVGYIVEATRADGAVVPTFVSRQDPPPAYAGTPPYYTGTPTYPGASPTLSPPTAPPPPAATPFTLTPPTLSPPASPPPPAAPSPYTGTQAPGGTSGSLDGGTDGAGELPSQFDAPTGIAQTLQGPATVGYARIVCKFEGAQYDVHTDAEAAAIGKGELCRYVVRQTHGAMEAQTLPGFLYYIDPAQSTPVTLNQQPIQINPLGEVTMTWMLVPKVPEKAIARTLGTVNQFTFDGKYEPGTLLLQGARITPMRSHYGPLLYTIEYRFLQRRKDAVDSNNVPFVAGWLHFRGNNGNYRIVSSDPSGDPTILSALVYDQSDFAFLFNYNLELPSTA